MLKVFPYKNKKTSQAVIRYCYQHFKAEIYDHPVFFAAQTAF